MEFLQKNARAIVIALLAVGVITVVSLNGSENGDDSSDVAVTAPAEGDSSTDESAGGESGDQTEDEVAVEGTRPGRDVSESDGSYSVTAEAGDNQTVLIRDVIAQYSDAQSVELSAEQRLFVETNLVADLPKSDLIFVGDVIKVEATQLQEVFSQAQELSESQIAAWAAYL